MGQPRFLSSNEYTQWEALCTRASEVFSAAATYTAERSEPDLGRASWYYLAASIWVALAHTPAFGQEFYDDCNELRSPAGPNTVAECSKLIAAGIRHRGHYYVLALDKAAEFWVEDFGEEAPPEEAMVPVGPWGQVFADALGAIGQVETAGCPCVTCRQRAARFKAWESSLGLDETR
jgi:hypothetical protein